MLKPEDLKGSMRVNVNEGGEIWPGSLLWRTSFNEGATVFRVRYRTPPRGLGRMFGWRRSSVAHESNFTQANPDKVGFVSGTYEVV